MPTTDSSPTSSSDFVSPPLSFSERFQVGASLLPPVGLCYLAARQGWLNLSPKWGLVALPGALLLGMLWPQPFRGWHRLVSRAQHWLGYRLRAGLFGVAFCLALLPLGLWLRWRGRSFLAAPAGDTWWVPARPPGSLRNQF